MIRKHPSADETIQDLTRLLGAEKVSTSAATLEQHGHDESYHASAPPDAVVYPESTDEISEIVKICARHRTPIIPFGAGSSLEGHVAALHGGICIDLTRMNRVLAVNAEDMDVKVEAGVTREQLDRHLRSMGLFFPVDPGADATLGGMASTRASGTTTVRYGAMRENVLSMTVVLPDGQVIRTASRARKSSAGYDLTRLFVGSEGTLGVIADLTLRLYGLPEAMTSAVCAFPTLEDAVNAVIEIIQSGVPVARIELLDEATMDAINKYSQLDYPLAPTLFFEFHGTEAGVKEQAETAQGIAAEWKGMNFQWTGSQEERDKLWQARHDAFYASIALRPGCKGMATDVCVPISRLAECILQTKAELGELPAPTPIVGHVGDGNFHLLFLIDPDNPEELEQVKRINGRMIERALAMEGTCTGEHGVGSGKIPYLVAEHGEAAVGVMAAIKRAIDPDNLMNPGKIIPS